MASFGILLNHSTKARQVRRVRRELIQFCDSLLLFLGCGYDLAYSWTETLRASTQSNSLPQIRPELSLSGVGLTQHLNHLTANFCHAQFRQWFGIFEDAYKTGSPMIPIITAFAQNLRREQERDFEEHCRNLPTRTNVLLLLFFLPPTLLLIFSPLLSHFGRLFE